MKVTLEKTPGMTQYGKKDLTMKLVRVDDKSNLG